MSSFARAPCFSDFVLELVVFICCVLFRLPNVSLNQRENRPGSHLGAPWGAIGAQNGSRLKQKHKFGLSRPFFSEFVCEISAGDLENTATPFLFFLGGLQSGILVISD